MLDLLRRLDNIWDKLHHWLRQRLCWRRSAPLTIAAYRGFGRADEIHIKGRVLRYKPLYGISSNSRWKSFLDTYRRFGSDEIRDAHLTLEIGDHTFHLVTDEEGFFTLDQPLEPPFSAANGESSWHHIDIRLTHLPYRRVDIETKAEILIPSPKAVFGVISDIDDTILQSHVTSILKLKMLYYTLFKNAAGRQTIQEVAAFYQALHRFPDEQGHNPFFYVSNSPWNLYDLLQEFMLLNHLPKGPILLRDIGIPMDRPKADRLGHKYETIQQILSTYPALSFLLIGDSGERDADIYLQIARDFPERISAIYIRDVHSPRRAERIAALSHQATTVDIKLIHHYREAAQHAAQKGLILHHEFEKWKQRLEEH